MLTDDEKFQNAILNGDYDALDQMARDGYSEGEDEDDDDDKAKTDEDSGKASATGEDNANDGDSDKLTSKDADSNTDEAKPKTVGDTSTHADIVDGIESKITFDDKGNAIVPKEYLALIAKNGKHEIPYGVLESARTKAQSYSSELEQERLLRQEAEGKLTKNDRQAAVLKKQLQDAGIDPEQLPEDIDITPELINSLDEYGDVGKVLKALIAKQGTVKEANVDAEAPTKQTTPDPRYNDFVDYKANHPEFAKIMDNEGSDENETLDHFYMQVIKSPDFKDKPLSVQLDEAMARTNRVMGVTQPTKVGDSNDKNKDIAREKVKEAMEATTPASPSEIGVIDSGKGDALNRARAATGNDLLKIMSELSQSELDTLLDEAD